MRMSRWAVWALASMGLAQAGGLSAEPPAAPLPAGTYSNEEQVYFAREAGETPPPLLFLEVAEDGAVTQVDAYGAPMGAAPALSLELFNKDYWKQDALEVAKTGLAKMKAVVAKV